MSKPKSLLAKDPLKLFERWFKDAQKAGEPLPEAMALATAGRDRRPSVRILLHKEISRGGFVFYTNYESRKADEIAENPRVAMVFHWPLLQRQVRIEGKLSKVTRRESEAYFRTRPRESRLGAWASPQSSAIESREVLEARLAQFERKFSSGEIPCPPHWGGYRLAPERIEFWQGRAHRLHDREVFVRQLRGWKIVRLAP